MTGLHKLAVAVALSVTSATSVRARVPRHRPDEPEMNAAKGHVAAGAVGFGHQLESALPPVLLTTPAFYGTLAAVRTFGRASIRVTTAGATPWNVSSFSRYSEQSLICPATSEGEALVAWLEEFGRNRERHVLLPTCDDTAWLYARNRERLSRYFYLPSTDISAVHSLLHKGDLARHAHAVGLDAPRSWHPQSEQELLELAPKLTYPLLVKPTTQALFPARSKGRIAHDPTQLLQAYREVGSLSYARELAAHDPSAARPMAQEFFKDASQGIYNIAGFIGDGPLSWTCAATKLLQRPRQLGVGLCFAEAEVDGQLALGLERLARRVGYRGVFEAEFVRHAGRSLLIDFNPRFYNQMGFDVARGLPLPLLAYYDALGRPASVLPLETGSPGKLTGKVFVHSSAFKVLVTSQRLSGALSPGEAEAWNRWYDSTAENRVDAVVDPDDVWPNVVDTLGMLRHHVRHPRSFLRSIVLNR